MKNFFTEVNPVSELLFLAVELAVICITEQDSSLLIILLSLVLADVYFKGIKTAIKGLVGSFFMMFFFAVFNSLFYHSGETPLLYVNDLPITWEAMVYGFYSGCLAAVLIKWFRSASEMVDGRKIRFILDRHFHVTALVITMVMGYTERFRTRIEKIDQVFQGFKMNKKVGRIRYAGILLSVLLGCMLEESADTARSMEARGYGNGKRSLYERYELTVEDILLVPVSIILFGACVVSEKMFLIASFVLFLIPVGYSVFREVQWKFYQSKI